MANDDIVPGFDDEQNDSLTIKLQDVPDAAGCLVVALNGYIDTYNSSFFQERIQRAVEAGFIRLIFDCNSLSDISSTGIGSFSVLLKTVKSKDGDIILFGMQPKVSEVFQLLGFSHFFNKRDNLDASIAFFRGGSAEKEAVVFPSVFSCPMCAKKLKGIKAGRFRCPGCKTVLNLDTAGAVSLG